ncbi:hypothetical protein PINS_up011049 [Pythium insidiosum]|nr:hypothetical protein PINS_up011049 [Pythium insidiosum]
MMEIAKNVRDFLVGMKETLSPEEEALLSSVQDLHEQYLTIMDDFSVQVSALALSMRPEARMVAHQLRLKIYQDWRARLMERIFAGSALSSSPTTRLTPPGSPTCDDTVVEHRPGCEDALCVCALHSRLAAYKSVITSYIQASTKIKSKRATSSSPDAVSKQFCEPVDGLDLESDDGGDEHLFEFPDFLGAPLRDRLHS